ncbi:MAG: hypothetical protein ACYDCM_11275 [Candidatus Acidiferrales bacterium]
MILATVPGMVALGCSGIRPVSKFSSAILADFAMRGFAISFLFLTLDPVALPDSFLALLCSIHSDIETEAVQSNFAQSSSLFLLTTGWPRF